MTGYSSTTALVVVDVQNDFADPEGSLFVDGAPDVIPVINEEVKIGRSAGSLIVRTKDWHPPSTPHFAKDGGIWPEHCVAGTWGADFHPGLDASGPVIRKGVDGEDGYSGFTVRHAVHGRELPTGLDDLLREHGITDVVVVGLATDYCVKETAIDAVEHGYACTVLSRGIRPVNLEPEDGTDAIARMIDVGVVVV